MKKEKKARDRLDFDFPTAANQAKSKNQERERHDEAYDVDSNGRDAWDDGGHVNFFTDLEKVCKPSTNQIEQPGLTVCDVRARHINRYLQWKN